MPLLGYNLYKVYQKNTNIIFEFIIPTYFNFNFNKTLKFDHCFYDTIFLFMTDLLIN